MLWEYIYIDFIRGLLEYDGYRIIMTCIDHFSKMVVLVTLWESAKQTVASHFLAEVVSHHRLPVTIN